MTALPPSYVREQYEHIRETTPGIRARANVLVSAVEELVLSIVPDAVIERRVDLVPGHEVRPELLVNNKLAIWVTANRLVDTWGGLDRDALALKQAKGTRRYVPLALIYDASAEDDNRAAAAAVRAGRRFVSGMPLYSARDEGQMGEFIAQVKKTLR